MPELTRKISLLVAGSVASVALAGCASYAILSNFPQFISSTQFLFARSLTFEPPATAQQVDTFLFPLTPSKIASIKRRQFGAGCSQVPSACTKTFSGSQITSFFNDASTSAGVLYEYTVTGTDNSTQSRWVEPLDLQNQSVDLTGPGEGPVQFFAAQAAGQPVPTVSGSNVQFQWQDIASKSPDLEYGYYIMVGTQDASSSTGIQPVYSAFLDESSHSVGVDFGTKSDLAGFSGGLLNFLANNAQFSAYAPVDATSSTLAPGTYAWTVIPIDMNASMSVDPSNPAAPIIPAETSYGIGQLPTFSAVAGTQFLVFQVK